MNLLTLLWKVMVSPSCADQSVGEIEELGPNPFHVLAWKASSKGSKPWNGKGAGKGKKSGQEKGKT